VQISVNAKDELSELFDKIILNESTSMPNTSGEASIQEIRAERFKAS